MFKRGAKAILFKRGLKNSRFSKSYHTFFKKQKSYLRLTKGQYDLILHMILHQIQ